MHFIQNCPTFFTPNADGETPTPTLCITFKCILYLYKLPLLSVFISQLTSFTLWLFLYRVMVHLYALNLVREPYCIIVVPKSHHRLSSIWDQRTGYGGEEREGWGQKPHKNNNHTRPCLSVWRLRLVLRLQCNKCCCLGHEGPRWRK